MNKELEALAILKQTIFHYTLGCLSTGEEKAFKVIEAALKRLERINNTKMIIIGNPSPNESAVNKLINERMFVGNPQEMEIKPLYDEVVDKKLEALEIIKEKGVNIRLLKETDNATEYNELIKSHYGMLPLSQKEYKLLKETLK